MTNFIAKRYDKNYNYRRNEILIGEVITKFFTNHTLGWCWLKLRVVEFVGVNKYVN